MEFNTLTGPYQRSKHSTTRIMAYLSIGLLIVTIYGIILQFITPTQTITTGDVTKTITGVKLGLGALGVIGVSLLATLILEVITFFIVKKQDIKNARDLKEVLTLLCTYIIKSYSYVTALIFALILPPTTHLYAVAVGAVFATLFGKLVFGGFGKNIANPAIVGRVFMSASFGTVLKGYNSYVKVSDTSIVTGSTILDTIGSWLNPVLPSSVSTLDVLLGTYAGAIGETATLVIFAVCIGLII
jgi:electron transport complex protein RnfD